MRRALLPLACLVALSGCSGLQSTGDKGYITSEGQVAQVAARDRGEPVELEGESLDGESIKVSALRGKPVVVVVWGSWCSPCRAEAPELVEAAEEVGGRASFVGINIRDSGTDAPKAFVRKFAIPYPSIFSPDGEALLAFSGTLTANSIPSFVVLDDRGRVAASIIGQLPSKQTLVDLTRDAIDEGTARG
jgi:thiol-disulfide isomerase/thioredoxin